jgi:hypothetical protein
MSTSTVTSEALQLKLRQLLPSQQGFGTDLSASDTIIPIIDLTKAAEGSDVGENLQTAIAFGSQTSFRANNSTAALANTAGFYRVVGTASGDNSGANYKLSLDMTDGATNKIVWSLEVTATASLVSYNEDFDLTFFLATGITLNAVSGNTDGVIIGSIRQIADINGTLVQPSGFTPQ